MILRSFSRWSKRNICAKGLYYTINHFNKELRRCQIRSTEICWPYPILTLCVCAHACVCVCVSVAVNLNFSKLLCSKQIFIINNLLTFELNVQTLEQNIGLMFSRKFTTKNCQLSCSIRLDSQPSRKLGIANQKPDWPILASTLSFKTLHT